MKAPGKFTSRVIAERVDDIVLVDEPWLERAVSLLLQIEKTVVEGAGAAGLAAILAHPERFAGRKIGLVLCGGNIDPRLLANVLLRDLARSGRLARLQITLQDRPGALYKVMSEFEAHNVNIIEIYHQRIFTTLPAKGLVTDIECEARDAAQLDRLIAALREKGYSCEAGGAAIGRVHDGHASPPSLTLYSPLIARLWLKAFYRRASRVIQGPNIAPTTPARAKDAPPTRDGPRSLPPIFRHQPDAVPLSAGARRAEGVYGAEGRALRSAERGAGPDRISPQPDGRLSAQLRRMPGLRFGSGCGA